jgi:hypothetical protein
MGAFIEWVGQGEAQGIARFGKPNSASSTLASGLIMGDTSYGIN